MKRFIAVQHSYSEFLGIIEASLLNSYPGKAKVVRISQHAGTRTHFTDHFQN